MAPNKFVWKKGELTKLSDPENIIFEDDKYSIYRRDPLNSDPNIFGMEMINVGLKAVEEDEEQRNWLTDEELSKTIDGLIIRLTALKPKN